MEPPPALDAAPALDPAPAIESPPKPRRTATTAGRLYAAIYPYRLAILVYFGTRALLLAVAIVQGAIGHHNVTHDLANWDGLWYRRLANHGYPTQVSHEQTTLGFFPLYPALMWLGAHLFKGSGASIKAYTVVGLVISAIGGLVATVLVQRLGTGWWGESAGRRAAVFFCVFPGSVVFSMVYAEGVLIPLAAGCILALERRRWILAGLLAGIATASEPEALVLVLVCLVAACREFRRLGWGDRRARRSLLAPLLSLTGVVAVASFFWAWTGTPFANLIAQHEGWKEKTDPFALVHTLSVLLSQISLKHFNQPTINANLPIGLLGALFLVVALVLLYRSRRQVSIEAIVWTAGISFLALTSEYVPPNPRLLITAFPAVMMVGRYVKGRAFTFLVLATCVPLCVLSAMTFVGVTLRP